MPTLSVVNTAGTYMTATVVKGWGYVRVAVRAFLAASVPLLWLGSVLYVVAILHMTLEKADLRWLDLSFSQFTKLGFGVCLGFLFVLCLVSVSGKCVSGLFHQEESRYVAQNVIGISVYLLGFHAALNLKVFQGSSPVDAAISGLYSWFFVGWTLIDWIAANRNQPIGTTLKAFLDIMLGELRPYVHVQ